MKNEDRFDKWPDFRFNLEEIAGAIGDYGTLFSIVLGVAFVSNLNLGYILLFFSVWYIITGLYYKMPMASRTDEGNWDNSYCRCFKQGRNYCLRNDFRYFF